MGHDRGCRRAETDPLFQAHFERGRGRAPVITLVDLTEPPLPSAETLQKLFGLTSAEARLAREIARGLSAGEAAEALGVKMATVRSQMAQIFAKTGTKRQGELVALLTRLAILP